MTTGDLDRGRLAAWKAELNRKLQQTIAFFYGNFVHGVRRCVIDGIEPTDRPSDSFQIRAVRVHLPPDPAQGRRLGGPRLVPRAVPRERAAGAAARLRSPRRSAACCSCTTHEVMLDDLLARPLESGDVLSNANTIILMGKIREGSKMGRALYVAKHRGSACDESIVPFEIDRRQACGWAGSPAGINEQEKRRRDRVPGGGQFPATIIAICGSSRRSRPWSFRHSHPGRRRPGRSVKDQNRR